eukprot:484767-Pleurochrysis_carterae.AAC.1
MHPLPRLQYKVAGLQAAGQEGEVGCRAQHPLLRGIRRQHGLRRRLRLRHHSGVMKRQHCCRQVALRPRLQPALADLVHNVRVSPRQPPHYLPQRRAIDLPAARKGRLSRRPGHGHAPCGAPTVPHNPLCPWLQQLLPQYPRGHAGHVHVLPVRSPPQRLHCRVRLAHLTLHILRIHPW